MKPKKIPLRMCVGCRESKPKRELIRVVRAPDGTLSMDPVGKKPGRGAYVCRQEACLTRAIKQKQLVFLLLCHACSSGSASGRWASSYCNAATTSSVMRTSS